MTLHPVRQLIALKWSPQTIAHWTLVGASVSTRYFTACVDRYTGSHVARGDQGIVENFFSRLLSIDSNRSSIFFFFLVHRLSSLLLLISTMSSLRPSSSPCGRYVMRLGVRPGRIPTSSAWEYVLVCPFGLGLAQRQSRSPPPLFALLTWGFPLSRLLLPSPAPRA